MMRTSLAFALFWGIGTLQACSQTEGFVPKNAYPGGGRDDGAVFVTGNKAYVGTGLKAGFVNANDFYEYTAGSDSWRRIADLPAQPRQYAGTFSLNGFGYLTCGIGQNNVRYKDCWKYNPGTDTWTALPDFPGEAREGQQTAVYGNYAYAFFGQRVTGDFFKQVWRFDGGTETWSRLPDFPASPRFLSAHAQTADAVYFVSGNDSTGGFTPEVWQFKFMDESWHRLADFPGAPRWYGKGLAFDSKLYFGTGWDSETLNDFWVFDPVNETWSPGPSLPGMARKGVCAFSVEDRAYVMLGVKQNGDRTDEVFELVKNASLAEAAATHLGLFPNPTRSMLYIDLPADVAPKLLSVRIYNGAGAAVFVNGSWNPAEGIDVSEWAAGRYLLFAASDVWEVRRSFYVGK